MISMYKDVQYKDLVNDVELTYVFPESIINTLILRQNVEISNLFMFHEFVTT